MIMHRITIIIIAFVLAPAGGRRVTDLSAEWNGAAEESEATR